MLTAVQVKNAKPKEKPYKLADGKGLSLHIATSGKKTWRYRYELPPGTESTFVLGEYPVMSLEEARQARMAAREKIKAGTNPALERKEQRKEKIQQQLEEGLALENSFKNIALEWLDIKKSGWTQDHAAAVLRTLQIDAFPVIGNSPIEDITPPMVLGILRTIENRGSAEIVRKVLQRIIAVFRYAIQTGKADYNPAADMKGALKPRTVTHRSAISAEDLPKFMTTLHNGDIHITTKLALEFVILTAARTGEVRGAVWEEIDLEQSLWNIPAERMKMNRPHTVPLSKQALSVLEQARKIHGDTALIFPGIRQGSAQLSENTLLYALYRLGYHSKATVHGFRATFSTIANEAGFNSDVIEKALAHEERNTVRAAYNRSQYLEQRRELMQWWADLLEETKGQGTIGAASQTVRKTHY